MKTRGTTIIPRIKYLQRRHAWDDVLPELSAPTREIVSAPVLAGSWYPFSVLVDVVRTADRVVGVGDLALAREMGRFAAAANLSTVFRILVRLTTPKTVLTKGAALWSLHHDTGRAVALEDGPRGAIYEIHDFGAPDRALCVGLEGWTQRCLELTGAVDVVVEETVCAARSGNVCRFHGRWRR